MLRFSIPLVLLAVFPNGVQEAEQRKTRRVLAQNYRPRRPVEDYSQSQSPHNKGYYAPAARQASSYQHYD